MYLPNKQVVDERYKFLWMAKQVFSRSKVAYWLLAAVGMCSCIPLLKNNHQSTSEAKMQAFPGPLFERCSVLYSSLFSLPLQFGAIASKSQKAEAVKTQPTFAILFCTNLLPPVILTPTKEKDRSSKVLSSGLSPGTPDQKTPPSRETALKACLTVSQAVGQQTFRRLQNQPKGSPASYQRR
jgi:hypothetical protein